MKQRRIDLSEIVVNDDLFLRDEYDMDAIQRYTERYKDDLASLPPIVLQQDTLVLLDGFHRKKAMEFAGIGDCLVEIVETDNPRMEAIKRNRTHGVPLHREERNRQIGKLYEEGETQSEIAELFGLSRRRIGQICEALKIEVTSEINESQVLKERFDTDATQAEIAESYGISRSRVSQIEGDFKNALSEAFLSGESIEEIVEDIKSDHSFALSGGDLRDILVAHDDVPACLVKEGWDIDLADCTVKFVDATDALDKLDPESVDCVLTDPPYGISFESPRYRNADFKEMENDDGIETAAYILSHIGRVLKQNAHAYMFTRWDIYPALVNYISDDLELVNLIVWNKGAGGHGMGDLERYAPQYELIMVLEKGRRPLEGKRVPNVQTFQGIRHTGETKYHPTQKPITLIKFLIEKSTKQQQLVLDPCLGSGTTAVACLELGRQVMGFEIDREKNEKAIKKRIARSW